MPKVPALERQELLDLLVAQLTDFVIVLADTEGNFQSWHPGVREQLGYEPEEFIGKNLDLLLPAAERLKGEGKRELETAARTGRASDTRWLVKKSGKPVLVEGVAIGLRGPDGALAGFGKVLHDVTERRSAEQRLIAVGGALDQSTVFIRDWDGVIEHWTAGCERLYGWPAEEAVGKVATQLLQTEFPEPIEQISEQLLQSGVWQGELRQVRRDGTPLSISAQWVLLSNSGDKRTVISTHVDITARLQMEHKLESANEQLKRMAVELERSNEELEGFARIVSHDLTAPITSTRWLADLLSSRYSGQLDADGQKCIKQISQGLGRMADLVDGLLSHALAGRSAVGSAEPVDATSALLDAEANLRKDIEISEATITHDALPEVHVERQPLTQLFQNLLSNAIKYRRPEASLVIRVAAAKEGSLWRFSVKDNGIGIEPEWLERVFHPLQRGHGLEISGSGIGLATCKKIVTRAGGRIWVESQVGSGSTFFFTLP